MTNRSGTLYIGMTNTLMRRIHDHRQGRGEGFTAKYRITRLLYAESSAEVRDAVDRDAPRGWR